MCRRCNSNFWKIIVFKGTIAVAIIVQGLKQDQILRKWQYLLLQ